MRFIKKILLTNEKICTRFLCREKLNKNNYKAYLVCSEEQPLRKISDGKPNLITLDDHSPKPSGIEFIQKISNNNWKNQSISGTPPVLHKQSFIICSPHACVIKLADILKLQLAT